MSARCRELVTTYEPAVVSESFLDAIVVEDSQGDGCFPDPPWTDESDWIEGFSDTDDLLNQLVTSEAGPWPWGRGLSRYARYKCEELDSSVVEPADLSRA